MIDLHAHRGKAGATLAVAIIASLTGCARSDSSGPLYYPTSVYGSTLPPLPAYGTPDPYHYQCTGQCALNF
jgi:hypothetical protein